MNAVVSGRTGSALLVERDKCSSIETTSPSQVVVRDPGDFPRMFQDNHDLVFLEGTSIEEVRECLSLEEAKALALDLALILLDPELSVQTRAEAAVEIEDLIPRTQDFLASVFYSKSLPESADLKGATDCARKSSSAGTEGFFAELGRLQAVISQVSGAWQRIPDDVFRTPEARQHFLAAIVHEGLFRDVVMARAKGSHIDEFLLNSLLNSRVRSLQGYRAILLQWIAPFRAGETESPFDFREAGDALEREDDATARPRHFRLDDTLSSIERQKAAILKALRKGDLLHAGSYVMELLSYQSLHGGPEHACKSLCDLAMGAQELHMYEFQLGLTKLAIETYPEDPWAAAQYAQALVNSGRLKEAQSYYETVIRHHPCERVLMSGRAHVLKAMNLLPEALAAYDEAIKQFPDDHFSMNGRAEVLKAMNLLPEALAAYDEIIKRFPDEPVPRNGRAGVLKAMNRLPEALAAYDEVTRKFPCDLFSRCGRTEVLKAMNRLPEALTAYDEIIKRFPDEPVPRSGRAEVLKAMNRLPEALAAYDEVTRKFPYDLFSRCGRTEVLKAMNLLPEALAAYDEVAKQFPGEPVPGSGRAEVLKAMNRLPEALTAYDEIIKRFPDEPVPRSGRAEVLKAMNRLPEALAAYDQVTRKFPYDLFSRCGRAEVLKAMNRLPEALRAYREILAQSPYLSMARNGLASALAATGRWNDALAELPTTDPVTAAEWVGYHIRGMILLKRGDVDSAVHIFERGIQHNPRPGDRDVFRAALAIARIRQGDPLLASKILADVKHPDLQHSARVFLVHAFGALGESEAATAIFREIIHVDSEPVVELCDELDRRYVSRRAPLYTEEWLTHREVDCLLLMT